MDYKYMPELSDVEIAQLKFKEKPRKNVSN